MPITTKTNHVLLVVSTRPHNQTNGTLNLTKQLLHVQQPQQQQQNIYKIRIRHKKEAKIRKCAYICCISSSVSFAVVVAQSATCGCIEFQLEQQPDCLFKHLSGLIVAIQLSATKMVQQAEL